MLAASATAGTLVGFGIIRGAPVYLLNTMAHALLGARALATRAFDLPVTVTGLALHVVTLILYGVIFITLCGRLRGWRLVLAAVAFAAVVALFDLVLLPPVLRPGFETVLGTGELVAIFVELATALVLGARIFDRRGVVA
ncbi:MAG TPA: hypothetical protein VJ803_12035 [Gemmatimonadaceae bacterium]|nr:hypothetical protein [Gemmatimonadaceae bacterium]